MTARRKPKLQSPVTLRRAKFLRPRLPGAFLGRPRLFAKLAAATNLPITLVVAPGGYGKSVLLASWVAEVDCATAWLSLDPADNDLRVWTAHALASIEGATKASGVATRALVEMSSFTAAEVAAAITSDILDFGDDLVLVLDDLHGISDTSVRQCLVELLRHPLPMLHLVIASREEPLYLPLPLLRAREQLLEIRVPDLRFSAAEIEAYFDQTASDFETEERFQRIVEETDGWPAGVSLTAMAIRNGSYIERGAGADRVHAMDFLFDEMLLRQDPDVQAFLIATSIVERVSGGLAAAMLGPSFGDRLVANEMLERLARSNEFVARLGDQDEWYAYHHLFRELLRRRFAVTHSLERRNEFHLRASAWYDANGEIDAAIVHALEGGAPVQAARIVENHGLQFPQRESYQAIVRWLSYLPAELRASRPGLQAVEGWLCYGRGQQNGIQRPVAIANALLAQGAGDFDEETRRVIEAHIALHSIYGEVPDPLPTTREALVNFALANLPSDHEVALGFALYCKGLISQALGRPEEAITVINGIFRRTPEDALLLRGKCLSALCEVWLGEANVQLMLRDSSLIVPMGLASGDWFAEMWGRTKAGLSHLLLGDPASAVVQLQVVRPHPRRLTRNVWRDGMMVLQVALLLLGESEEAERVGHELIEFLSQSGDAENLAYARSAQARCALIQGRIDVASQWLHSNPELTEPLTPYRFETDSLTRLRILLALGTVGNLRTLLAEANRLLELAVRFRSRLLELEVRLILAAANLRLGNREEAIAGRSAVLNGAASTGFILPFLELRSSIAPLFSDLSVAELYSLPERLRLAIVSGQATELNQQTLNGHSETSSAESFAANPIRDRQTHEDDVSRTVELLTDRELDVLTYMAARMSNKEIANELSISPLTVKRHVSNILEKLEVRRRSQAAERARSLGILQRQHSR